MLYPLIVTITDRAGNVTPGATVHAYRRTEDGLSDDVVGYREEAGTHPLPSVLSTGDDGKAIWWVESGEYAWTFSFGGFSSDPEPVNIGGFPGPAGPQGDPGPKGDTGDVGPAGAQGLKGDAGVQGPQGLKGDVGDAGPAGAVGPAGAAGAQGAQGLKGDQGDPGDQGPAGAAGAAGAKGDQGDPGPAGAAGPKGDTGDVGPAGAAGVAGAAGPKGDKGDTGDVGPQGPAGAVGAQGPAGPLIARDTKLLTTGALATNANETGTVVLAKGYRVLRIATDKAARVRLYTTAAKRDADLARSAAVDPNPATDHGLVLEATTSAALLAFDMSPVPEGHNLEAVPSANIPYTVTNLGAAGPVNVTFTWQQQEA